MLKLPSKKGRVDWGLGPGVSEIGEKYNADYALFAETQEVEPKIPPGYTPDKGKDELGIWMEMEEYETAVQQSALRVRNDNLNNYVQSTACRVAGAYCRDLRVYVIRNPGFNASMTANGMVQVWTGLLMRVSSEDELAAVLGHELAHYTHLHTLDRLRRVKKSMTAGSIVDLGLSILTGANIPMGRAIAVMDAMAFSRANEQEADLLGAKFMARAGYDPHASYRVWNMLANEIEELTESSIVKLFGEGQVSVATASLRPNRFGEDRGVLFDILVRVSDGPNYGGITGAFVHEQQLFMIIYLGAEPYYYAKHRKEAEAIILSARI